MGRKKLFPMESESHSVVSNSLRPYGLQPARFLCPWNSPGKNTAVGCCSLLQGIVPTQGSNPCLSHCRQIPYCLSHQGSPKLHIESPSFQGCPPAGPLQGANDLQSLFFFFCIGDCCCSMCKNINPLFFCLNL